MSFKKKVIYNLFIQAIGPGLSFLSIFLIARFLGPATQGKFANFKSIVDLTTTIGVFGFPQSFVYLINKLKVPPKDLAILSIIYSVLFTVLAFFIIWIFIYFNYIEIGWLNSKTINILVLSVICGVLVLHGVWRGVYLGYNSGPKFALLSILPAVFLFVSIAIFLFRSTFSPFEIYLYSTFPVFIFIWLMMSPILLQKAPQQTNKLPWNELWRHGFHAFLQALAMIVQPIVAYWLIKRYIGTEKDIGFFSLGLFLVQGFAVPIGMISPLLFERWTKNEDNSLLRKLHKLTPKLLLLDVLLGLLLSAAIYFLIPILFSKKYVDAIFLSQVLLFTVPLMFHIKVLLPAIHAGGFPQLNTHSGILRIVSFAIIAMIFILCSHITLITLAIAWSLAEVVASAYTFYCLRVINKELDTNFT